jgi:predicted RND superfamily exporter protein
MFKYVSEDMINDPRFAVLIDDATRQEIMGMKSQLDGAINQLLGKNHSLMMIETSLPFESAETTEFMDEISAYCSENLESDYYFIGNTPMSYEMEQSFDRELLLITLLTAIAIFIVVAFTFRSLSIPAILVLLVQCGVYLTMTVNSLIGYSIYYLALLIVQCILMGATIDYAILFTNYYRESRKTMDIKDSIKAAYEGSIHTILTSGLIMILVTGAIGFSPVDPTIAQVCQTISIGALSARLLILFILPGVVAALDKLTDKQKKKDKTE